MKSFLQAAARRLRPIWLGQREKQRGLVNAYALGVSVVAVTWNPSAKDGAVTLSGSNLTATRTTGGNTNAVVNATASRSSGLRYFEHHVNSIGAAGNYTIYGIATGSLSLSAYVGSTAGSYGYELISGNKYNNGSSTSVGTTLTTGDVWMCAVNFTTGNLWFGKNGTWLASGNPATGANPMFTGVSGTFFPAVSLYDTSGGEHAQTARFKLADFTYTPPTGFGDWETP